MSLRLAPQPLHALRQRRCSSVFRAIAIHVEPAIFVHNKRNFATSSQVWQVEQSQPAGRRKNQNLPFSTIQTCPPSTCDCAATPAFPEDLEIDHATPLNGAITGYAEQVLICTDQDDWASRIEEENSGDNLAADLKELFGRGGIYTDPFHNISILNSSFPSSIPPRQEVQSTSAYLFPSFKYVPFLPRVSFEHVQALAKGFLLPEKLHSAHTALSPIHRDRLTRSEAHQALLYGVQDVSDVVVLICGHGGRDMRCGLMGPVLRQEFEEKLAAEGLNVMKGPVQMSTQDAPQIAGEAAGVSDDTPATARVGLISHIGGHKFAGNIILYIPPAMKTSDGEKHPLAGHGIWYGRVEPKHVDGIIKETVLAGRVVADMFRGGIDPDRRILRL